MPRCWGAVETDGATLQVDVDATVKADASPFTQLLENLFRNAVEHTGPDVTVTFGGLDDGFYVADDGPGVPADKRETAFEAGHTTTRHGSDLGLTIVKQVCEDHGWDLQLTEGTDGGARFEVPRVAVEGD